MEAPRQIKPTSLADYFEVLSKAVFQSGISWRVVEAKWEGTREAFHGFDPQVVADLTPLDVESLVEDPRVIRNRRKIEATIENAGMMVKLNEEAGGFDRWLSSHAGFEETVAELRSHFRFVGETGAYFFLYVVGRPVPSHEAWMAAHRPASSRAGRG
jgi:DNA-3-methyladenine glycosylase I